MSDTVARIGGRRATLTFAATAFSVAVWAVIQLRPILFSGAPFSTLHTAFWHDQLGYLSIVTNVAGGRIAPVEPMTETGVIHYPQVYYTAVGLVARLFGAPPVAAWNAVSVLLQVAAIVMLALTMAHLSRRWWAAALAPLPFLTGTLSVLVNGGWNTALEHHAVLWGPFGTLFSNNAETAGLCIVVIVLSALAWVYGGTARKTARVVVGVVAALALGSLSGFQTYSFLVGAYVVTAIVAASFLSRARWPWLAATAVLVVLTVASGGIVEARVGQLAALVWGLLPTAPGLVRGLMLTRGRLAVYAILAAAAAAPQIVWTLSGIVGGDPFLTYRVASNVNLGVAHWGTVVASLPIGLCFAWLLLVSIHRRDRLAISALAATGVVAVLLAGNDLWGPNAEPYRFWLDMVLVVGAVCALAGARALAPRPIPATARVGRQRWAVRAVGAIAALVYVASLADVVAFTRDPVMSATWDPASERETAIAEAVSATDDDGLVTSDACVDPRTLKIVSGARIAHFYLGMAWPDPLEPIGELMTARENDEFAPRSMESAGAHWIVTDSACARALPLDDERLSVAREVAYSSGVITLWRFDPSGSASAG